MEGGGGTHSRQQSASQQTVLRVERVQGAGAWQAAGRAPQAAAGTLLPLPRVAAGPPPAALVLTRGPSLRRQRLEEDAALVHLHMCSQAGSRAGQGRQRAQAF